MSYKYGPLLALRCIRSSDHAKRFLSMSSSRKKDVDSPKVGSVSQKLPIPVAVRYEDTLEPYNKPKKGAVAAVEGALDDCSQVSGVPEEHVVARRARIFVAARAATQSGNNNTKLWKIELDNRERWENPLMGWSSSGDPISNVGMQLDFASQEDAIRFCLRQGWEYEVEEEHKATVKPKAYGSNFSWSKKTRVTTK